MVSAPTSQAILLKLGYELVQQVGGGGVLLIHFIVDLAHRADGRFEGRDDPLDGVLGVDQARGELGECRGLGNRGAAAVRQGVEGAHALGEIVREAAGGVDDLIQLEVKVPEVGPDDIPVRLLALNMELDQVHQDCLQVGREGG